MLFIMTLFVTIQKSCANKQLSVCSPYKLGIQIFNILYTSLSCTMINVIMLNVMEPVTSATKNAIKE
jgi:hypothetical protein